MIYAADRDTNEYSPFERRIILFYNIHTIVTDKIVKYQRVEIYFLVKVRVDLSTDLIFEIVRSKRKEEKNGEEKWRKSRRKEGKRKEKEREREQRVKINGGSPRVCLYSLDPPFVNVSM